MIALLYVIPYEHLNIILLMAIPTIITLLFAQVVVSGMKTTVTDIIITVFGICYIVGFIFFIPLIHGTEHGKFLIWYIFLAAWGTDTFAYFVGVKFGKHKFTKVSPKKSIEGCIGGTIGAVIICLIYTLIINAYLAHFHVVY